MLPFAPTPLLARIPACLAGLFLAASISLAHAQTMPEIQRLMKQGQLPQALAKADLYIAARPREAQGRFMKGLILTEMGRADEAIATFTRLTEDFPELPEPYNNLAVLHARLKQYDKALAALEMAIRAHPDYAVAYENLGDIHVRLASLAYDKAAQLDARSKSAPRKLALARDLLAPPAKAPARAAPVADAPAQ